MIRQDSRRDLLGYMQQLHTEFSYILSSESQYSSTLASAFSNQHFSRQVLTTFSLGSLGDDITWKMHPSSCYFVTHFRKKVAFTLAECQGHCIQDNRCAMAQYQRPFCALTSDTTFRTFACEMESVLSIKGTDSCYHAYKITSIALNRQRHF